MEELWTDINLSALQVPSTPTIHHRPAAAAASPAFLQDFLKIPSSSTAAHLPPLSPAVKNRFPDADNGALVNRRHKRKIMNRESASRSRARKQAYIYELELKVASLEQEITWLKYQQQHKKKTVQPPPPPVLEARTKPRLQRTTSSPI